jgi:hypothetical protein
MKNLTWLFVLALAMGSIAAGCGSDDDDGGDGGDALTKEEYLAQGNAICAAGNAELQATDDFDPKDEAAFDAFVTDTLVPNIQGQVDQLREGIPEGDEDTVNGILDDAEAKLDEIEADPQTLQGGSDPFSEINKELDAYGLTTCANPE